jgi:hypothetical protein
MCKIWGLKTIGAGYDHLVNNGVNLRNSRTLDYWREVLGCKNRFDVTDKYAGTVKIKWDTHVFGHVMEIMILPR